MKKLKFLIIFMAILVLLESAITGFAAENNNDFATADEIAVNKVHTAYANDAYDYYWFLLNSDGYINVELYHKYNSLSQYYTLFDENQKKISSWDFERKSEKSPSVNIGLKKGKYYLKIYSNRDNDTSEIMYTLKIAFTATSNWEKEFNNEVVGYTPISLGTKYYGTSYCWKTGDLDYYKFSVPTDSYVSFVFNQEYGDVSHTLTFKTYDLTKEKYVESFSIQRNAEQLRDKIFLKKGDYYFVVDASCSYSIYNFTLSLSKEQQTTTTTTTTTTRYNNPTKEQTVHTTLNPSQQQGTDNFDLSLQTEPTVSVASDSSTYSNSSTEDYDTDRSAIDTFNESADSESIVQTEEANDKAQQEKPESDKTIIIVVSVGSIIIIAILAVYIVKLKKSNIG